MAARYGDTIEPARSPRATPRTISSSFIEAYKWVTSYLRAPEDYALVARETAERLLAQNVVYAEITLSAGVMLLRKQDPAANLRAIREAVRFYESLGLRLQWIFDCVRQFGAKPAMEVARIAVELRSEGVVAFGIGGDELALPASDFRDGLRPRRGRRPAPRRPRRRNRRPRLRPRCAHPFRRRTHRPRHRHHARSGARRHAPRTPIPLEICPISNLRTGALARQIGRDEAELQHHPLPDLLRAGVPLSISTDDPAMFDTDLQREYLAAIEMGLSPRELARVAAAAFQGAFLPVADKFAYLDKFTRQAAAVDLV